MIDPTLTTHRRRALHRYDPPDLMVCGGGGGGEEQPSMTTTEAGDGEDDDDDDDGSCTHENIMQISPPKLVRGAGLDDSHFDPVGRTLDFGEDDSDDDIL
jgi:hypothetical protein